MAWFNIGTLGRIPRGGAYRVRTPDGDVTVFRSESDELSAWRQRHDTPQTQHYKVRLDESEVLLFVPTTPSTSSTWANARAGSTPRA
jgi:hypothetical protein